MNDSLILKKFYISQLLIVIKGIKADLCTGKICQRHFEVIIYNKIVYMYVPKIV